MNEIDMIGAILMGVVFFVLPVALILWSWWWVFEDKDDDK